MPNASHEYRSDEPQTWPRARRVAVLSDVHGNVPALEAVLADVNDCDVEAVVFCGDLSWGAEPNLTVELVRGMRPRALFVRGNADRAVVELASGARAASRPREEWMLHQHSASSVEFLAHFATAVALEVQGLGPVRFCHGSPRSDIELVTPGTSSDRLAELASLIPERVLVTGHTHVQFDRTVARLRSVNSGSVGLPYHDDAPGVAYWATLGPDVHLRRTHYDVNESVRRSYASGDPGARTIEELLMSPRTVADVVKDAEARVFSD